MDTIPTRNQPNVSSGRRTLLKALGATGLAVTASTAIPGEWAKPVIEMGFLPAHAQYVLPPVATCIPVPSPADIMLTVDMSGSVMADLPRAKTALLNFVAGRDLGADRIGLAAFNVDITGFLALSQDKAAIDNSINQIPQIDRRTSIRLGIERATTELTSGQISGNPKVLLLLSDGLANEVAAAQNPLETALEAAQKAKAAGIRIISVALRSSFGVDVTLMRDMASSPSDFYYVENLSQLENALGEGCN